jgi:NAD(P)-dependent dehydrogenase (short-subunit alcohol dehydrogenase family)
MGHVRLDDMARAAVNFLTAALTLDSPSNRSLRMPTVFSIAYVEPRIGTRIAFLSARVNYEQTSEVEMGRTCEMIPHSPKLGSHVEPKTGAVLNQLSAKRLEGKVAVITGGSTGIGLATAKRFVLEGADRVFITGRRKDVLESAVAEIGEKATGIPGDVSSLTDLDRLYEAVNGYGRKLDLVFANAGIWQRVQFGTVDESFFDLLFDANVKGLFFTVQKALPQLKDGASVILNASIATAKGFPDVSVYSATKAAVRSFARTWTNELRERRIRVNAVSPGRIDTPIFESLQQGEALTQLKRELAKDVPLGRLGDPDEIAKAVVFLGSDEASYISGIELFVDGGLAQI